MKDGLAGKITTAGAVTTYPISDDGDAIAAGPDGALWIATHGGVFRLTTGGVIDQYTDSDLIDSGMIPSDITKGPDGTWFTDPDDGLIARVSPNGVISKFSVPASPTSIVAGADGNMWLVGDLGIEGDYQPFVGRYATTGPPTGPVNPSVTVAADFSTVIRARINPQGLATTIYVDWGPTQEFGNRTVAQTVPAGVDPIAFEAPIGKLLPDTVYSVRITAQNSAGTWTSSRLDFVPSRLAQAGLPPGNSSTTLPFQPGGGLTGASGVGSSSAAALLAPNATRLALAKGIVRLPLTCSGAACNGAVTLSAKIGGRAGTIIGTKAVKVVAGRTFTLGLRLNKAGIKAVRKAGKRGLGVIVTVAVGGTPKRYHLQITR